MSHIRSIRQFICLFSFAVIVSGCTSVPETPTRRGDASFSDSHREFYVHIESTFRKKVAFFESADVTSYLEKVAARLLPPGKDPIRIELVNASSANYPAALWALPNGKVYFDIRVLKALRFENEIAAAIIFSWNRAEGAEFQERILLEAGKAEPNPEIIWKFSEIEDHRAIEVAVDRLYKSGYDPRGLVSFFDRLPSQAKNMNNNPDSLIDSNKDKARRTISYYAPLLNPIVRTEDFYRMRKKLERL